MATNTPRIAVFGAGAVGGYLGGKLWASGTREVTLIGRQRLVEAVQRDGLIVREGESEVVTHPAACSNSETLGTFRQLLLTVRTYDVASSLPDVQRLLCPDGVLLAWQNGVGTEERLAEALGQERVFPCTLTVSEGMEEPGVITRYSRSGGIALSSMSGAPVPTELVSQFERTGLPTVVIADYRSLRWSKLLLNMLGAATSAILDVDIGTVMHDPGLFRVEQLAVREAGRVMDALGIQTVALPGYPVPLVRRVMRLPRPLAQRLLAPRITASRGGRSPGMRGDMTRGRTEAGDFNGAIARAGEQVGIRTPVNAGLAAIAEHLAADPVAREEYRGKPQKLTSDLS